MANKLYSKDTIQTATNFFAKIVKAVESIKPMPFSEIGRYIKSPKTLAVVDQAIGPDTSTVIARPIVNIGIIKGSLKVNIIPENYIFEIDIQLSIGLVADQIIAVIDSVIPHYPKAIIELKKQETASNPSSFSSIDYSIVEYLIQNIELIRGLYPAMILSIDTTDCKHYRYTDILIYIYSCSLFSSKYC